MGKRTKDDNVTGTGAGGPVGPSGGGLEEDALPTLSPEEIAELMLDKGVRVSKDGLEREEQAGETGNERMRRETMSTGKKLIIVGDLTKGMTIRQVAKKHGISVTAVMKAAEDPELYGVTDRAAQSITKKLLAGRFYQLADLALSHIDVEKLKRMDGYRLAFMAAVALDKGRLLEGESTENLSFKGLALNIHTTLEQLKEKKRAVMERVAELRTGPIVIEQGDTQE